MVWDVATVVNPWIMLRSVCTPLSAQIHGSILMGEWAESNVFIQKLSHWILNRDCLEALINMNYLTGRNDAKAETPVLWPPHAKR